MCVCVRFHLVESQRGNKLYGTGPLPIKQNRTVSKIDVHVHQGKHSNSILIPSVQNGRETKKHGGI